MLTLSNLSKRFGSLQALDRLSLSLEAGEIVGFVGANGAGKSTTMRIVMGVLAADCGTVTWKGSPWTPPPGEPSVTCPRNAASTPG